MIATFIPVVEEFSMTHSRQDMKSLYKNVHSSRRVRCLLQGADHVRICNGLEASRRTVCVPCGIICPDAHNRDAYHNIGGRHLARVAVLSSCFGNPGT